MCDALPILAKRSRIQLLRQRVKTNLLLKAFQTMQKEYRASLVLKKYIFHHYNPRGFVIL